MSRTLNSAVELTSCRFVMLLRRTIGRFQGIPLDNLPRERYVLLLIIAITVALRLPTLSRDFLLDEIWSLFATTKLMSAVEVFTRFTRDNNHPLNTLYLYALGDQQHWALYRFPSFLSGLAVVLLAWWIVRREGFLEAVLASTLTSFSYLLIYYSSEARGYSMAIMFAFAGFYGLGRFAVRHSWPWAIVFWSCTVLGMLSHPTFLFFFVAARVSFPLMARKGSRDRDPTAQPLSQVFLVPEIFLILFALIVLRRMIVGGASPYRTMDVLMQTLSYAGGGPPAGLGGVFVGLIVGVAFLAAILWYWHRVPSLGFFYLAVVVGPFVLLVLVRPQIMAARYFLLSVAFGLLAISGPMAHFLRRGGIARTVVVVTLALYTLGNSINTVELIQNGQGGYKSALDYIESHTSGPAITVTSDHDFRTTLIIDHYKRFLQSDRYFVYYTAWFRPFSLDPAELLQPDTALLRDVVRREYPRTGTQWFIVGSYDQFTQVPVQFEDPYGNVYRLGREYHAPILAGMMWRLYQRIQLKQG